VRHTVRSFFALTNGSWSSACGEPGWEEFP